MRYLGVDYGTKRVGIALSDEAGTMGFPHAILANTPGLAAEVAALAKREGVGAVVIGESRNLDGEANPIHAAAHALGDALQKALDMPVVYEPEAYTSALARRAPERTEKTRAPKARAAVDASAAALILTSYLSRNDHGNGTH
jgi:putative Holliday junction resolvase